MKSKTTIGRLLEFAEQYKTKMILSLILGMLGVFFGMFSYYSIIKIAGGLYYKTAILSEILFYVGLAVVGELLKFLLSTLSMLLSHNAAYSIMENIRKKLASKMMRVPLGVVSDTPSGKLKAMIVDTVEKLEKPLAHMLPEITANVVTPLFIVAYLFYLDYRIAFAALLSIPIGIVCMLGQMKDYKAKSKTYMKACADMDSTLVEYVNGIKVIKTFNQSTRSFSKFSDAVTFYHDTTVSWWKNSLFFSSLGQTVITSAIIVTLPVGAYLFMDGRIPFEIMLTGLALSVGIAGPILQASSYVDLFAIVYASINQIADFLNQNELDRKPNWVELENKKLEMKNVSFTYGVQEVLSTINLTPHPKGITAIVGPSGGGKSTIAKMFAGFYDPKCGDVLFGGKNLKDIPFEQLMAHISFVSQDNYLFDMSIMDNIRVGKKNASDEEVILMAKSAGCHEFIAQLEKGYQTMAGDGGKLLSGGEKQRITIARAMLKSCDIIILDEATAFVDPENEQNIQKAIKKLIKGKTLIIIAHRLSTIVNADKIVVVNKGKIIAEGTQDELLEKCELYKNMWHLHSMGKDKVTI